MSDDYNPIDELRKVVDTLTAVHEVIVEDREGTFLGTRRENPLLLKLFAAVASNLGGAGGAGSDPNTRVPINVGARDLLDRITARVMEWYADVDKQPDRDRPRLDVILQRWRVGYLNQYRDGKFLELAVWSKTQQLDAWVTQIRDLLDPPRRYPIDSLCPNCGRDFIRRPLLDDPREEEIVRVLNAVEREKFEDSYILCESCARVWQGNDTRRASMAIDAMRSATPREDTPVA